MKQPFILSGPFVFIMFILSSLTLTALFYTRNKADYESESKNLRKILQAEYGNEIYQLSSAGPYVFTVRTKDGATKEIFFAGGTPEGRREKVLFPPTNQ